MKSQIRHLVADALYPVKAHTLPSVCERYGLEPGDNDEAFRSKTQYVMRRVEKLSDEKVLKLAQEIIIDYPDDKLISAVEQLARDNILISDLTRRKISEILNSYDLGGKPGLLNLLRSHWPEIDESVSRYDPFDSLSSDIERHMILNDDWLNSELLEQIGFYNSSQSRLFRFLEDIVHPVRRDEKEQNLIADALNDALRRDGFNLIQDGHVSGYPTFKVKETTVTGHRPSDQLISSVLTSYDESGVHEIWAKTLDRRIKDPEGAITSAKSLLESVSKHIADEAGATYGANDDLPKLYAIAAECLSLAPSQHSEKVFKAILGNCQSIVGNLAGVRNKLGDAHGQGKKRVKPQSRHAELAVNLAGTMAMFMISTWNARNQARSDQ